MSKEEIIKALRDMAKYPTVTLPRDSEALKAAADLLAQLDPYAKGYADAMNWKVQNHLEHLPVAQPEQEPVAYWNFNNGFSHCMIDRLNEAAKKNPAPLYTTPPPCPTCEALARTVMMDQTGRDA